MNDAPPFNPMPHLKDLLARFKDLTTAAIEYQTPNAEDDEFIRCGIVGFAHHTNSERWDLGHYDFVRAHRDEILEEKFSADWCRIACLAAGYFLGMWEAGLIDEVALRRSSAITPGFMWLHTETLGLTDEFEDDRE
jgi:hypothetical protein